MWPCGHIYARPANALFKINQKIETLIFAVIGGVNKRGVAMAMSWHKETKEKFDQLMLKIPVFMRKIAQEKISQAAQDFAKKDNRSEIIEKDLVDAFFKETPFAFYGPMKADLQNAGIDYTRYGYDQ